MKSVIKRKPAGNLNIIDVNISYTNGESVLSKVTRLVTGNYLPREVPFIGRVLSASYFFTAGQLYESGGQLYGSLVFLSIYDNSGGIFRVYQGAVSRITA